MVLLSRFVSAFALTLLGAALTFRIAFVLLVGDAMGISSIRYLLFLQ
jgi:hypothetical protein